MRMKVVLATAAVAAVSLVPAASAERAEPSAAPKKTVHVGDYFFAYRRQGVRPLEQPERQVRHVHRLGLAERPEATATTSSSSGSRPA